MTKRPAPFLFALTAVSSLVASGTFAFGLNGCALATEISGSHVASRSSGHGAQPRQGWYAFGAPAAVVEREEIASDDVTLVTLSNGVRLVLKPTNLVDDEVLVNVIVDGGVRSLAPEPGTRAAAEIAGSMFVSAGVGLMTHEQLVATFGPVASSLGVNIWAETFNLDGKARSAELRPLLEILTAYVSDPGWRSEGLDAAKAAALDGVNQDKSNALIAMVNQAPGLLTRGDPRYIRPSEAQIRAVDEGAARRAIENQLRSGAIEIAIVGDFDPEEAITMAAATFGTLPPRPGVAVFQESAPQSPPHTATPIQISFNGRPEDQGRMLAWPAPTGLFMSKEDAVIGAMLGVVIYRLLESPAYQTTAFNKGFEAFIGYLYISAVDRPNNIQNINDDVARIASDIVARGVSEQEVDRVNDLAANDIRFVQSNALNQYWIITAMNIDGDRNNWEKARSYLQYAESVTAEDIQEAAARYLVEDRSVEIIAVPEPASQTQ